MVDVFSQEKRSDIMRAVKSHNNASTELKFITFLRINKITGWRRNYKLYGHPDFVFPKYKITVFIDGCFWHGHNCRNTKPQSNSSYWSAKIRKNIIRDKKVNRLLKNEGWFVVRIWECSLKNEKIKRSLSRINKHIAKMGGEKSV